MGAVLMSGLIVGLVYGLLGMGVVLTYQVSRIVNFAYGEIGMIAAFVYFELRFGRTSNILMHVDRGLVDALPVALVLGAVLGVVMERTVIRPLSGGPRVNGLVASIATTLLLLTFARDRWGVQVRMVSPLISGQGVHLFGLRISPSQLLVAGATIVLLIALTLVYRHSDLGLRLRAAAVDPYAASLAGIDVDRVASIVWALAGAISALSAILVAPLVSPSVFFMTLLTMRSFAAAVIGGLTSLIGTFVTGVGLGLLEAFIAYESPVRGITPAVVAVLMVLVMVVRPRGLIRASY